MKCGRIISGGEHYVLTFKSHGRGEILPEHVRRVAYRGKIYCLNVPHHTLYVRRNGRPCWNGNTPACIFMQEINGGWVVFDELCEVNKDTNEFAPMVKAKLATRFPWVMEGRGGYVAWGDPQGDWRGGTSDKRTPFALYAAHGIVMRAPALKDRPLARLAATRTVLATEFNGLPRLRVHPRCVHTIEALDGGAQVRRIKTTDGMRLTEEIVKNAASHVFEALGYGLWGGGEVREMLAPAGPVRQRVQNTIPKRQRILTVGRRMRR